MAEWNIFKCPKCGYTVKTEPKGYYALMSGMYYNFSCSNCRNIVSISGDELSHRYKIYCPKCGKSEHLSTWNPIDGKCPVCRRRKMKQDGDCTIMAD